MYQLFGLEANTTALRRRSGTLGSWSMTVLWRLLHPSNHSSRRRCEKTADVHLSKLTPILRNVAGLSLPYAVFFLRPRLTSTPSIWMLWAMTKLRAQVGRLAKITAQAQFWRTSSLFGRLCIDIQMTLFTLRHRAEDWGGVIDLPEAWNVWHISSRIILCIALPHDRNSLSIFNHNLHLGFATNLHKGSAENADRRPAEMPEEDLWFPVFSFQTPLLWLSSISAL